ncbi:hypothetical protein L5515_015762 [Caenorhabditis briggsae]|uniref:MATH domain-containing protein n=1 Tax=Caenorhabditis briggsae TaxID=6238 RepID=A0AAE9JAL2_CAEBR|nr:hypothetical protein L5515_015762 [Caenorhabditis briggsae]
MTENREEKKFVIKHVFKNVQNAEQEVVYGNEEKHFGIFWKLRRSWKMANEISISPIDYFQLEFRKAEDVVGSEWSMEIENFLELINGETFVNDDTVEGLLHLADFFDSKTVFRKLRYKLDALKKKCLSELKTTAEIRELVPENAHDFGPDVWKELFLKAYSAL